MAPNAVTRLDRGTLLVEVFSFCLAVFRLTKRNLTQGLKTPGRRHHDA